MSTLCKPEALTTTLTL